MTINIPVISTSGAKSTVTLADPSVAALPTPWSQASVGAPALAGSATWAANVFTIKGAGADIWATVDQFHFVYQTLSGDGQIVARVVSETNTDIWARAGVMIKQSTTAGTPYALIAPTPAQGTAFQANFNQNALAAVTVTPPNAWLKLVRVGSTVTGYSSANGTTWAQVGTATVSGPALIGLFVNSHNASQLCTATFDNVMVTFPGLSITGKNITVDTADLTVTPSNATMTEIGRSADSVNGPWSGSPTLLPFTHLQPNTAYTLYAIVNGVRCETQIRTLTVTPPPVAGAFFDDFNGPAGSAPNPTFWARSTQSWTGGIQQYQTGQVFLDGLGNCVIEAKQVSGQFISGAFCGKAGGYPQPGAAVPLSWGYGRLESRIKMPKGFAGCWPAWWFLGEEFDGSSVAPNGWPYCGEMDIMEEFSDSTYYYATSHGPGGPNTGGAYNQSQVPIFASDIGVADLSTDYHVYWCERRMDSMTVGIDNLTKATFTAAQVIPPSVWALNKNVFPIFDFMLYNPVDASKLPARMLIDWVKFTPA